MRAAIIQMTSSDELDTNLKKMQAWITEAARGGARLVAFPEMAYFIGKASQWEPLLGRYEELCALFAQWAMRHGVFLLPGTLREPSATAGRYHNTQLVFAPNGQSIARYRKIFLFKANLPDRVYDEGRLCDPGREVVCQEIENAHLGLAICYDLRFPELFRALRKRAAQLIVLPASFTVPTGSAHWSALLRARAIENQVFVLAPAQVGQVGDGAKTYGHSCLLSPWGEVIDEIKDAEGLLVADLDLGGLQRAVERVDAWSSRREDILPIA